jgi:tetratricopeptide (TPR) repeat protein/tRNA A-37 threonylcarbamoyl transferase component Bud32
MSEREGWPDLEREIAGLTSELIDDCRDLPTVREGTSPPQAPAVPDYEVLGEIARGGMGVVYKARQVSLNRPVALKMILKGERATEDDVRRFRTEAEAVANLDHPNIVPIYEVGEYQGQHFFAMKLIEGGNLTGQVAGLRNDPRAAARLLAAAARAVHYAHQRGTLHRDLKPANVLLDALGQPHVTDFGLAKRVEGDPGQTQSGAIVGTPSYMPPEQARAEKALTTAVDVYSLGAILYELLAGRPPFRGATVLDTLRQVQEEQPTPPRQFNPRVALDLEKISLKCLEKDPAKRYASAEALADDLERFLKGEPVRARSVSQAERLLRWCKRRPALASLAATVAVVFVVGLAATTWQWRRAETALVGERQQRRQAQANLKLTHQVLIGFEEMDREVSDRWLPYEPRLEKVRTAISRRRLRFFEGLAQQEGGADPFVRYFRAQAWTRAGNLRGVLGETEEAEKAYRLAATQLAELAADFPADTLPRRNLAGTYRNLGQLLKQTGRLTEAEQVLDEAIRLWTELAAKAPDEPAFRHQRALSVAERAEVRRRSDRLADAEADFREALAAEEKLAAEFRTSPDYQSALMTDSDNLGLLLVARDRPDEAGKCHKQAVTVGEKLVAAHPNEPYYRHTLASASHNLAKARSSSSQPASAEAPCRRAIALHTELARDFPGVLIYRHYLANHWSLLADMLLDKTDRSKEALPASQEAIQLLDKLTAEYPTVPAYRNDLAISLSTSGIILDTLGHRDDAERAFRRSVEVGKGLVKDFPDVPEYENGLAVWQRNLAELLMMRGKTQAARSVAQDAVQHARNAVRQASQNAAYRKTLSDACQFLAEVLVELQEHAAAASAARDIPQVVPHDAQARYDSARVLAACVPLAESDWKLSAEDRQRRAEVYAGQAIDVLRQAMGAGFPDINALKNEPRFKPLHKSKAFQEILSKLSTQKAP